VYDNYEIKNNLLTCLGKQIFAILLQKKLSLQAVKLNYDKNGNRRKSECPTYQVQPTKPDVSPQPVEECNRDFATTNPFYLRVPSLRSCEILHPFLDTGCELLIELSPSLRGWLYLVYRRRFDGPPLLHFFRSHEATS
jgi:hypothetical protein